MREAIKLPSVPRWMAVYDVIKLKIITGELTPNTSLTEEALAEELQVSRTPIREALRMLEQDHLVELIPRKGAYVKGLTINDIEEIFTIRESLEGICARNACELITDQNIAYLETVLQRAEEEYQRGNLENALKMGNELHDIILKITGNKRILSIISNLNGHIQRLHFLAITIPRRLEISNQEHWAIFHAIQKRDGEAAEQEMRAHIRSTRQSMIIAAKNDLKGF